MRVLAGPRRVMEGHAIAKITQNAIVRVEKDNEAWNAADNCVRRTSAIGPQAGAQHQPKISVLSTRTSEAAAGSS